MILDRKWTLIVIGSGVLVYSIAVLGFILTTPDVGLRVLLLDDSSANPDAPGIPIHVTSHLVAEEDQPVPESGDRLIQLGKLRTHSLLDFACQFVWLRNAQGGLLRPGDLPSKTVQEYRLQTPVKDPEGKRWVEVVFQRASTKERLTTFLLVQSLPLSEVFLSFVWFSFQLGFFLLSAILCWNRPFDRSARVLFGLAIVGLGAFIVGNHWWVMAADLRLIVPCAACGILLPAVFLHFCLVFPRSKPSLQHHHGPLTTAVYALPVLAVFAMLAFVLRTSQLHDPGDLSDLPNLTPLLEGLKYGIKGYLIAAGVYFFLALAALWRSYRQAQESKEQRQLRWIWYSATFAAVLILATLVSAFTHPVAFSLGSGRLPTFLASISFMVAFSVAIVRQQLMQVDEIGGRNMLYYVASLGLTGIISLLIAMSILVPKWFNLLNLSTQQALTIAAVLTVSVILLLWLRDLFQQMIERQFFRGHYRLDKALERIQQSVAKLSDPKAIAQLFLSACRDVLGVERGALYLRLARGEPFQLMALAGAGDAPPRLPLESTFLSTLKDQGSLQRISSGSRSELTPEQAFLWEFDVDLVHGLDSSDDVACVLLLGHKPQSSPFTSEDLIFLNALGQIANVAIHSGQIVDQNIARLNQELQLKLDKIAEQQRQISRLQAQLMQSHEPLDKKIAAKSEFRREACKGDSPAMVRVLETARKVAASESSVLIRGESGTGKEVIAQVLHDNSPRAKKPMIRVHCAALSPSLLESELFGHVKGAFTGAHQDREGRFEAANGGTLFLDEIGDISLETQIKLLRVLQERCFEPVGSVRTIQVDVRLITATHQNLEQLIQTGRFREDLFYRLNVISMELPPLRQRREDIMELALHFLSRAARRMGKSLTMIDDEALEALERYHWPGNIRELENVIERAVVLAEGTEITLRDLPAELTSFPPERFTPELPRRRNLSPIPAPGHEPAANSLHFPARNGDPPVSPGTANGDSNEGSDESTASRKPAHVERRELEAALEESLGNKTQAARLLGMPRSTFFSKLKRHGLV